jgi:hypothetical protein
MTVADSSQLSTQFHALLVILIASSVINNPSGDGHAVHDISYRHNIMPEDDHLYRRPTLHGVLNALATIFVWYSEIVATTAVNTAGNVASDILTTVQVEAEGLEKLEELALTGVTDFLLVQNGEKNASLDGSSTHCTLIEHGTPFQLEHSGHFDLIWWQNLVEKT